MGDHEDCTALQCQFAEAGEAFDGYRTVLVRAKELRFDGCPQVHMQDSDVGKWLGLSRWLNKHHMTPTMMGLRWDQVDPRYFEAMELIDEVLAEMRQRDGE